MYHRRIKSLPRKIRRRRLSLKNDQPRAAQRPSARETHSLISDNEAKTKARLVKGASRALRNAARPAAFSKSPRGARNAQRARVINRLFDRNNFGPPYLPGAAGGGNWNAAKCGRARLHSDKLAPNGNKKSRGARESRPRRLA